MTGKSAPFGSPAMQMLEACVRGLNDDNEMLLPPARAAPTRPAGVALELRVVLAELWAEDHHEVHRLVRSALDDLAQLAR